MNNRLIRLITLSSIVLFFISQLNGSTNQGMDTIPTLENPVDLNYLMKNLNQGLPRLILTTKTTKQLKSKLKSDPVVQNVFEAIKMDVAEIVQKPLLERIQKGRRLLAVSREMLYRINMLGITYVLNEDQEILNRIDEEVLAVCAFEDWNPSHFLDVAEMSLAVSLALDWTANQLPESTITIAKKALIEKGLKPSYDEEGKFNWWVKGTNNWNQVCHAGMVAAAITIAKEDPILASHTISRALDGIPHALAEYGPDGVYPEGSTYWSYGTSFTVMTASMFESAFGTDFGLGDFPGLQESAIFRALCNAPSGWYYNFADCGDKRNEYGDFTLAWFARITNNATFYEEDRFLNPPPETSKLPRHAGAGLVWLSQIKSKKTTPLPNAWVGHGANPIAIIRDENTDFYLGAKGGRGTVNHGNMDAGSFVFELNGIRWVVDPGNQNYHDLEKTGFDLWGKCQDCERWTLLTKNNFGHSTLTVNNQLHVVDGQATITKFQENEKTAVTIDLSPTFVGQLSKATRTFRKTTSQSLAIIDEIQVSPNTQEVTWQLMTTAEVEIIDMGAILKQDDQQLKVENLSHPDLVINVVELDPPPLALDRNIKGLKRLEFNYPVDRFEGGNGVISVLLSGQ